MSSIEGLQARHPTFTIRSEPDPDCPKCKGAGERHQKLDNLPNGQSIDRMVPCWCCLFSNPEHGRVTARELPRVGRRLREAL